KVVSGLYSAVPIPGHTSGWSDLATGLQELWAATSGGPAPAMIPSPAWDFPLPGGVQPGTGARYSGVESALGVLCSDSPNPRIPAEYAAQDALARARSGVVGPDWVWPPMEACA